MRAVETSRFVRTTPKALERLLTPERLVEYEGSFTAETVEETDDGWVVTATGPGLRFRLRFERRVDGMYYTQDGDAGPFESMETWVTVARENEGSRVTMRSRVSLSVPLPLVDRLAAWKRRGELRRALDALEETL